MPLLAVNFVEELQTYLADNSGLGLVIPGRGVTGGNFTIGNLLNVDRLEDVLGSEIVCTMFEEGGNIIRTSRRHRQERTIRFLYKGEYGQAAVNSCWLLLQYLEDLKTFQTDTFRVWVARADKLPTVIAADQGGTHLADFVITFFALYRTG